MCTCGDDWHANNAANHSPSCPVLEAFATLTRKYDRLIVERDALAVSLAEATERGDLIAAGWNNDKQQLAAARALMTEAAEDIEYMVNAEYHGPDDVHPAMRAKYKRDIEIVERLRDAARTAALSEAP